MEGEGGERGKGEGGDGREMGEGEGVGVVQLQQELLELNFVFMPVALMPSAI